MSKQTSNEVNVGRAALGAGTTAGTVVVTTSLPIVGGIVSFLLTPVAVVVAAYWAVDAGLKYAAGEERNYFAAVAKSAGRTFEWVGDQVVETAKGVVGR